MPKVVNEIHFTAILTKDKDGNTKITSTTADLVIGLSEYPDMPTSRKGVAISLNTERKAHLEEMFINEIIPQAEAGK